MRPRDDNPALFRENVYKSWKVMAHVVKHIQVESWIAHLEPNPGVGYDCLSLVIKDSDGRIQVPFMMNRNGVNSNRLDQIWAKVADEGHVAVAEKLIAVCQLPKSNVPRDTGITRVCDRVIDWISQHEDQIFYVGPLHWPGCCETRLDIPNTDIQSVGWPIPDNGPDISLGINRIEVERLVQRQDKDDNSPRSQRGMTPKMSELSDRFPAGISEQIGAYVYALRDPQSRKIFYIGKGVGDRVFAHAKGALNEDEVSMKNDMIREIQRRGDSVEAFIVQHGLSDHKNLEKSHAHQTESALYGLLSLIDPDLDNPQFSLANLVAPPTFNEFGLRSLNDVIAQYGQPANESELPHNSVLIKPTRTWRLGMPSDELYEMTRGWWTMSQDRVSSIRFVFSIPKFIIRAVYQVPDGGWREKSPSDRDWTISDENRKRMGFDGIDVSTEFPNLINRSVEHLFGKGQAKRKDWKYLDDHEVSSLRKKGLEPWWDVSHP